LAVQVKREIGGLWEDTEGSPYTDLFNASLTSATVWKAVLIMRTVDDELQRFRRSLLPRADMLGIHLNRVILHLVFREPELRGYRNESASEAVLIEAAKLATSRVFPLVAAYIERHHNGEYLASLCKNGSKCSELAKRIYDSPTIDKGDAQFGLFADMP
jgi:hypothetical protein